MNDWEQQILRFARQHPKEPKAAYCRWVEPKAIHPDTLRKALLRDPEFREAFDNARMGVIPQTEAVDFQTFIRSPQYLGLGIRYEDPQGSVLPVVAAEAERIVTGNYSVVLLTGSLGSGKTYCSALCIAYLTYRLLLEQNPHQRLGLDPNTCIVIGIQSQSQKKAKANDYNLVRNFIEGSDWFALNAPIDDRLKSKISFIGRNIEIRPAGPNPEELIGENCYMGLLDETNFWQRTKNSTRAVNGRDYDQARASFEAILRRQHSRFDQGVAGPIFIASSKRFAGDFTDQIRKEFGDSDALYVYDHTMWTSHPQRFEGKEWFRMYTGNRHRPPRILSEDEILDPQEEQHVIEVPAEFRRSFKRDPVGSLMEIAGHSAEVYGGYFTDMEQLHDAASLGNLFRSFDVTKDATQLLPDPHTLEIENPESPRHVHLDLALTGDNAAIGIGHIAKYDDRGLPVIRCDGIARVHPPTVGQIELDRFLQLIANLKGAYGIPIASVSADGFQSYDLTQRLSRLGLKVGRISVDQTEANDPMRAYECLRNAINEGRFSFPDDDVTVEELKLLQIDRQASRGLGKVDHLPGKTKDVSDCLAGIAFSLTHLMQPWQLVGKVSGASYAAATAHQLGGTVTGIPNRGTGYMELIRANRGMPSR